MNTQYIVNIQETIIKNQYDLLMSATEQGIRNEYVAAFFEWSRRAQSAYHIKGNESKLIINNMMLSYGYTATKAVHANTDNAELKDDAQTVTRMLTPLWAMFREAAESIELMAA